MKLRIRPRRLWARTTRALVCAVQRVSAVRVYYIWALVALLVQLALFVAYADV